jgi:hypothetical protein
MPRWTLRSLVALAPIAGLAVGCHKSSDSTPDDVGVGLLCGQLLSCDQKCGDSRSCTDACYAQSTAHAQALFNAFDQCLNANCPSAGSGPCADPNSSSCSQCNQSAATGACIGGLANCENDDQAGPPNTSGDAGDSGTGTDELACGALVACIANCPHDVDGGSQYEQCVSVCKYSATPQALALDGLLQSCLDKECPRTPGGVCEHMDEACAGCQEQAVFAMPNVCADPWTNCQNDRSDTGDASTTPTVLDDGGVLTTLVTGMVQSASELRVLNGYLYFAEVTGDAPVQRFSIADAGTITLPDAPGVTTFGPPTQTPAGIEVDEKNIYVWSYGTFTGKTSLNNGDGTVFQIPLDGSPAIQLDKNMEDLYDAPYLTSIAIDSKNVYWVKGASGNDGVIMKAPIGGAAAPLYTNQQIPEALATDGTNVYWADWGTFDASGASNNDATIWQGSVDGGTPIMLASNQQAPSCIVVDSQNVYWNNLGKLGADLFPATNSGSIMQVKIGGGTVITVAGFQAIPTGLAVGNGSIYWTDYGLSVPGVLMSIPIGGTTPVPLVTGLNDPFSLTVSGKTLYWTNTPSSNGHGTIMTFTPP